MLIESTSTARLESRKYDNICLLDDTMLARVADELSLEQRLQDGVNRYPVCPK